MNFVYLKLQIESLHCCGIANYKKIFILTHISLTCFNEIKLKKKRLIKSLSNRMLQKITFTLTIV